MVLTAGFKTTTQYINLKLVRCISIFDNVEVHNITFHFDNEHTVDWRFENDEAKRDLKVNEAITMMNKG